MNIPCVKGNHDEYCSTRRPPGRVQPRTPPKPSAGPATSLTAEERQWLRDLKYSRMVTNFTIVHATLDAPAALGLCL